MERLITDLSENPDFVDVTDFPGVSVDLRYGSANNFMNKNIYNEFKRAYLHKIAADKLKKAIENLKKEKPDWKFLLLDCLRPARAHMELWKFVAGTEQEPYVANPEKGSLHSFGFAVDLTLIDEYGKEVDMGTPYDSFHDLAQPKYEKEMLEKGLLTQKQYDNRLVLRKVMEDAGFRQLSFEWWHYDADDADFVRKTYQKIH